MESLVNNLPQHPPFRFVDRLVEHREGYSLQASFDLWELPASFRSRPQFPAMCVIEGLAQTAVLFVQLETSPLQPDEFPVLGSMAIKTARGVNWQETLQYEVESVVLHRQHGVVKVRAYDSQGLAAEGELGIARKKVLKT